jgi:hypothetical protein
VVGSPGLSRNSGDAVFIDSLYLSDCFRTPAPVRAMAAIPNRLLQNRVIFA